MSSLVQTRVNDLWSWIKQNPIITSSIGIGAGTLTGLGISALVRRKKRVKKRKSTLRRSTRRRAGSRKGKGRIKHRTSSRGKLRYHKTKHRGSKAIHYTKNKQPYIILANGRARFIKKTSARSSKRRKGGRY